jgi:hypothetical protein
MCAALAAPLSLQAAALTNSLAVASITLFLQSSSEVPALHIPFAVAAPVRVAVETQSSPALQLVTAEMLVSSNFLLLLMRSTICCFDGFVSAIVPLAAMVSSAKTIVLFILLSLLFQRVAERPRSR